MHSKEAPRRRHSLEFKERVLAACAEPGASVAAVARLFELNDNLVHRKRLAAAP
jgi:transposase